MGQQQPHMAAPSASRRNYQDRRMMDSIGTVLTPQMKEQAVYVSDDGQRFDNAEDFQLRERLADKVEAVNQVILCGAREEGDDMEVFPPLEAQKYLDISPYEEDLGRTLGNELFGWQGSSANFLEVAKDLKTFSDWLWS